MVYSSNHSRILEIEMQINFIAKKGHLRGGVLVVYPTTLWCPINVWFETII